MYTDQWKWMQFTAQYYDDEIDSYEARCPFCNQRSDELELQISDYATHVMIWGYKCCGKYSIADCLQNSDLITHPLEKQIARNTTLIPMLFVKKMLNDDLLDNEELEHLSDDEKLKFIKANGVDVNDWDPMIMTERGYRMDHDGIIIYLLCQNIYGQDVLVEFWGD